MLNMLNIPQPEADFKFQCKILTFPQREPFFAPNPGNVNFFFSSKKCLTTAGILNILFLISKSELTQILPR